MRAAMKLVTDAQDLLQKGDVAGAKRSVDTVIQRDPTFWLALYVRAQIYSHQGKYDLALKDCNQALRQDRSVVEAALLRANINAQLGKYAEALKEYDYLISLHPRNVTLARVLSDRAWFRATCPNVASEWATSGERRKGCVQHYDVEGRAHDRYSRRSVRRDWRFQFSGSVRLASADSERYFSRQQQTFPATFGIVPTEQADSVVTFSTPQCDTRSRLPRAIQRVCL